MVLAHPSIQTRLLKHASRMRKPKDVDGITHFQCKQQPMDTAVHIERAAHRDAEPCEISTDVEVAIDHALKKRWGHDAYVLHMLSQGTHKVHCREV